MTPERRKELRELCERKIPSCSEILSMTAALPELLAELDERDKPCVWKKSLDEHGKYFYWTGCSEVEPTLLAVPNFCPNCGHRVEVKKQ